MAEISETQKNLLAQRSELLRSTRNFFYSNQYLEVDTPLLAPATIPEAHIELFATDFVHPFQEKKKLFLLPSPEYWLKQIIGQNFQHNIFQLGKCFRNAEQIGVHHNIEFTMLEWYTLGATYKESLAFTQRYIEQIWSLFIRKKPLFQVRSMRELFSAEGIDLEYCLEDSKGDAEERIREAASRLQIDASATESWEDTFHKIFLSKIEPKLEPGSFTFVTDYPSKIKTLARDRAGTPWAERWELYFGKIEIANCYTEEISKEKIERFFREEAQRKEQALVPTTIDVQFPALFADDYPACSGVALGIDRLAMVLFGATSIDEVIWFPFLESD